jgi:protein-disulfide isomerase
LLRRSLSLLLALALGLGACAAAGYMAWQFGGWVRTERAVALNREAIFRSPASFVAGNPQGDVSVVAFFDHNCPDCRERAPDLAKLIATDRKVRLVLKELPVLGPDSEAVARVAQASIAQGKYFELYQALFALPGRATKDKALRIASELGLDTARLEADMQDGSVAEALADTKHLAKSLGVRGVPFYLVGDRAVAAGPDGLYDRLASAVADIRTYGCRAGC